MDYLYPSFGTFMPQLDKDASVKFILGIIFADKRFGLFLRVLTEGEELGGMGSDPGWIIERRDSDTAADHPGYEDWPPHADFHAYVYEDGYLLAHPHMYLTRNEFHGYIKKIMKVFLEHEPENKDLAQPIIDLLQRYDEIAAV